MKRRGEGGVALCSTLAALTCLHHAARVSGAKRSRLKEIRAACGVLTANDMTKDGGAGVLSLSQGYGTKEQKPGGGNQISPASSSLVAPVGAQRHSGR